MPVRAGSAKSSPTIRDIGRLAGVSASTVSRVLNGDPRVTEAHRTAVQTAVGQVHYRPCSAAQWLARGKSRAFGVLTQDITSEFYGQILEGIVLRLRGTGYCPIFTSGWPGDESGEALELLLRNRVEALIAVGLFQENRIREVAAEIPFLNIGPTIPGLEGRCVIVDNVGGAHEATRHLLSLGHQRIAHIAGPAYHRHSPDRVEGYRRALADVRRKVDPRLVVEGDFTASSGEAAVGELLRRRVVFTAIFAANDCMAYGALHALFRHGLRVPRDLSIVGFDDRPNSAHTTPALTTMRQPLTELGTAAVEALLGELRGEPPSLPVFSTPLVLRESTAKPRAGTRMGSGPDGLSAARRKPNSGSLRSVLAALAMLVSAVGAPGAEPPEQPGAFDATVKPFLSKTCFGCHNAKLKTASLDLEAYETPAAVAADPGTWEKVALNLRTGQMPPAPLPRPDEQEREAVLRWIAGTLERAVLQAPPDPGRVTARRLNRTEYNNTVRDLLGVDLRPADDFPQDDSGYGFDNIADVLSLSPVLMERYLATAEKLAHTALFGSGGLKATLVRLQPRNAKTTPCPTVPPDYDRTGLSLPNAFHATHRFPVEGDYVIRLALGGFRPLGSEPIQVAVWLDGQQVKVLEVDPAGSASFEQEEDELYGLRPEFRTRVTAGEHLVEASILHLYEGLPASYGGPNPSRRPPPPPRAFKPPKDASPEKIEEARKKFEARQAETKAANEARVSRVDLLGPYDPVKGPSEASLRKIYSCGHLRGGHGPGCPNTIVGDLARRAFRRPVTPAEITPFVRLVSLARKQGDSLEAGIAVALQAILVSPDFLFRIEKDRAVPEGQPGHLVGEHELASRLSYFLWASMPDDELLRCADEQVLRRPEVLGAQVRRMLKDERAGVLGEAFGGQWLQFRALESVAPDRERFADFDDNLRRSMRRETELFFENVQREDRSVLEFLDAPYSFLNERLAQHYGLPGVVGPEFRRVDLTGTHRGGVLTQASVLTVSSYPTRTSPVLRGKWILENFLNAPPPPPPAGVPRLDEATVSTSASLRDQMEAHRKNTTCASCHRRMDPLGFGLENYDAIGRWRTMDGKFPVDASGALPEGRSFQGPDELKAILTEDKEAFAEAITEKLLTYALGRGLERYDRPAVKTIAGRLVENDYRFSALVLEIVNSMPFQMRRGERGRS